MSYPQKVSVLPLLARQMVNVSPVKLPVGLPHHCDSMKASITSKLESTTSLELENSAAELGSKIKTCINRRK
jgi:hypothetical protein